MKELLTKPLLIILATSTIMSAISMPIISTGVTETALSATNPASPTITSPTNDSCPQACISRYWDCQSDMLIREPVEGLFLCQLDVCKVWKEKNNVSIPPFLCGETRRKTGYNGCATTYMCDNDILM